MEWFKGVLEWVGIGRSREIGLVLSLGKSGMSWSERKLLKLFQKSEK